MSVSAPELEPMIPRDTFALRLLMLRHELGLTVDTISAECGIASATWTTWEHGTRPRDMAGAVDAISRTTGYSREWLMWGGFPLRAEWQLLEGGGEGPAPGQLALRLLAVG